MLSITASVHYVQSRFEIGIFRSDEFLVHTKDVAFMYAHTPVCTAEIWKKIFQFLFPYSICQSYPKIGLIVKF